MTSEIHTTERRARGGFGFWYGVAAGPVLWAAHLSVSYALASLACQKGFLVDARLLGINALTAALLLITLAFLVGVGAGGWLTYRRWQALRETERGIGAPEGDRSRFLMFSGLLMNILFGAAMIMSIVPVLFFRPCS